MKTTIQVSIDSPCKINLKIKLNHHDERKTQKHGDTDHRQHSNNQPGWWNTLTPSHPKKRFILGPGQRCLPWKISKHSNLIKSVFRFPSPQLLCADFSSTVPLRKIPELRLPLQKRNLISAIYKAKGFSVAC